MSDQNEEIPRSKKAAGTKKRPSAGGSRRKGRSGKIGQAMPSGGDPNVSTTRQITSPPIPPTPIRVLGAHVDTLDIGYLFYWPAWDYVRETLYDLRTQAKRSKFLSARLCCQDINIYAQRDKYSPGATRYPFHIECPVGHIFIANAQEGTEYPNIRFTPSSRHLLTYGYEQTFYDAVAFLNSIGCSAPWLSITPPSRRTCPHPHVLQRVDIAADILLDSPLTRDAVISQKVHRATKTRWEDDADVMTGFYVGQGGDTVLRVYNKSTQLKMPDGAWLWEHYGIAPCDNLWRIEFQLRAPTLRKYGVKTIHDLSSKIAGIWKDLTTSWFSLREPSADTNPTRRAVTPFWAAVESCADQMGSGDRIRRATKPPAAGMNPLWHVHHVKSSLVNFAALTGITNPSRAATAFSRQLASAFADQEWYDALNNKRVKAGLPAVESDLPSAPKCPPG
jgi:hypothetical protein